MPDPQYDIPNDLDVTPEDIGPGADLAGADLTDANLRGADLTDADLRYADLTGANLRGADLTGADLLGADLTGANLSRADLTDARLKWADLTDANLREADLTDANLKNADLPGAFLFEADLPGAKLKTADLTEANLFRADLTGANLRNADLPGANLRNADLTDADLESADLTDAGLNNADLTEADLQHADLTDATLREADLTGADLRFTTIKNVIMDNQTQFGSRLPVWLSDVTNHARAYHDFRIEASTEGYDELARDLYILEQKARTRAGFPRNPITLVGGLLSGLLTGYGVRPRQVLLSTSFVLIVTTLWFNRVGVVYDRWTTTYELLGFQLQTGSAYYSVTTFVTAPPHPPQNTAPLTSLLVTLETYVGTVLTVLLGYVLSNRSRI